MLSLRRAASYSNDVIHFSLSGDGAKGSGPWGLSDVHFLKNHSTVNCSLTLKGLESKLEPQGFRVEALNPKAPQLPRTAGSSSLESRNPEPDALWHISEAETAAAQRRFCHAQKAACEQSFSWDLLLQSTGGVWCFGVRVWEFRV